MDLLPAEIPQIAKRHGFRSLKLLNVDMDQALGDEPFGVDYGRLENGLHYYVRSNSKPKMRAALALAVKAGSVLEEEDERGVAHIVEHLAFSATKKYTNHDIVKFLESVGAEFGACQNAVTSSDDTVYELFVPVDKPELLSQAISVLAEFSSEVRVSTDDLEKERGAVMEEYRGNRNANGRMQDAHWVLMMEGSKYADRLPIGLEKVIRTVPSEVVKQFYRKWYHLHNMAVIAVGDFSDTQSVVELIRTHFGPKSSAHDPLPIPHFPVPSHEEPRFSCFVESEAAGSAVMISYKMSVDELKTVKDYKDLLTESMFLYALNQRLFKISRRKDPPYFSCSAAADVLAQSSPAISARALSRPSKKIRSNELIGRPLSLPRLLETLDTSQLRTVLERICERHPDIGQEVISGAPRPTVSSALAVLDDYLEKLKDAAPYGESSAEYTYYRVKDAMVGLIDALFDFTPQFLPPIETQPTKSLQFLDGATNLIHKLPDWEPHAYRHHKENAYEEISKAWALVINEAAKRGGGFNLHSGGWDQTLSQHNQQSGGRLASAISAMGSSVGWMGPNGNGSSSSSSDPNSILNQLISGSYGAPVRVGPF